MNVLITGGCGFIGSHLVDHHMSKGHCVQVVDDLSTGQLDNIVQFKNSPTFSFSEADILTWPELEAAISWADRIYHMAAVVGVYRVIAEPIQVLNTNTLSCERLLRLAKQSGHKPRILIASSSEVYGQGVNTAFSETDDLLIEPAAHSRWNYAISKLSNEAFGLSYAQQYGLPVTLLRLFNTVGARQSGHYGMVLPRFVEQAVSQQPITVYGNGQQSRSFCDVRDTVEALDRLANQALSIGEVVNVGNDKEISINALAELVKQIAHSHSPIIHIPYQEAYGGEVFVDIQRRKPNLEKFYKLTAYQHRWSLKETIEDLVHRKQTDQL